MTQRSGCLQADCITLIVIPDELDAMIESDRRSRVNVGKQLDLEVRSLGSVFLHEIGVRNGCFHVSREAEPLSRCFGRQTHGSQRRPRCVDVFPQVRFSIRCRIRCDNIKAVRQILCCPAGTDDSGTDDGNSANRFVIGHA